MIELLINALKWMAVPDHLIAISLGFVVAYYLLSITFWKKNKDPNYTGAWKRGSMFDIVTSVLLVLPALFLLLSVIDLCANRQMTLSYLLWYYGLLILFFSFAFSLIEWHKPKSIEDAGNDWTCELRCMLVSVQSITGLGYTTIRPVSLAVQVTAALEALVGIFFIAIFVAKAVASMPVR